MPEGYTLPPSVGPAGVPTRTPGDDWAAQIQGAGLAPTAGVSPLAPVSDDPMNGLVYLGPPPKHPYVGGTANSAEHAMELAQQEQTMTIGDALSQFEQMDRAQQRRLALLLTIGGYVGSVDVADAPEVAKNLSLAETLSAYMDLLDAAAGRYLRGQKITPEKLLEQNVAYRLPVNAKWDGTYADLRDILAENNVDTSVIDGPLVAPEDAPKDLSGTRTTTSSNTTTTSNVSRDIMDPNDAMALTRSLLQRELGRDPTKAEFEDFISAVQAAQRAHPTRSRSTTTTETTNTQTTNKRGRVTDSSTDTDQSTSSFTRSGITAAGIEDLMLRKARANPDWAEWQAVGTYAPALFQALGATVPGV